MHPFVSRAVRHLLPLACWASLAPGNRPNTPRRIRPVSLAGRGGQRACHGLGEGAQRPDTGPGGGRASICPAPGATAGRFEQPRRDSHHLAHGRARVQHGRMPATPEACGGAPRWSSIARPTSPGTSCWTWTPWARPRASWVWSGATCLAPLYRRCLLSLSRGGADAVVVREFDLTSRQFVEGGFQLPEAKSSVHWRDADTVWVATHFGPGLLTKSGYARVVKEWKRGHPWAMPANCLPHARRTFPSLPMWIARRGSSATW